MQATLPAVPENSTTVRSFQLRALRAGLSAAARVAPELTATAAERLFFTPPLAWRRRRTATAGGLPRDAEPLPLAVSGTRIAAWRVGEGPAVLLVHGWGGRAAQLAAFVPALRASGLSPVLFDGPAHGGSGGRTASVVHFAEVIAALAERTGARAAIGHSMGGASVGLAMARGLALDAAVLVGAVRSPGGYFRSFSDALGLAAPLEAAVRRRIVRRVGIDVDALDLVRMAPEPAGAAPLLVVHDRDDREVPFADGAAIAGAWPGARLVATGGLGHRRVLRDPAVVDAAVAFVAGRLPRCGCGRLASDAGGRCGACALSVHLADRAGRRAAIASRGRVA